MFFLLALALSGCSRESEQDGSYKGSLTVALEVDEMATDIQTKSSIPAEQGETQVNSLYLLFFQYASDGSGSFVKQVEILAPKMSGSYSVEFDAELPEENDYAILALANVESYLGETNLDLFLQRLSEMTEQQAYEQVTVSVNGAGTDETDDSEAIEPDNLVMSARVVRLKDESKVTVKLTRGVSRFDVTNTVSAQYDLVSASIWGAASGTPLWYDKMTETPERLERFYGIKRTSGFTDIKGGLYAFENYVSSPGLTDQVTTCLILGLKPYGEDLSETTYYRVNIHPAGSSQNLLRNNAYNIKINSVSGAGAESEYDAWTQSTTQINVTVNEWSLDDNGLILTDGTHTIVIPVKLVRLDPDGDVRQYTITTFGPGSPVISRDQLPGGITAVLSGNLLTVTAEALTGTEDLRGSIEISLGTLRGTISFIQSPANDVFLTLDRYDIPDFLPLGRNGISDNTPLTVTASGAWTATIYNTSEDAYNPGFSFYPSGDPVTVLKSGSNPFGNLFQMYTTGDNPVVNELRHGFVIVSLDEDPENYSRVVVLTQAAKNEIVLTPSLSQLRFSAVGIPQGITGATADGGFEISIDPGKTNGVANRWEASVEPSSYFLVEQQAVGAVNKFIVRAKGTDPVNYPYLNLNTDALSATLKVVVGETILTTPITQDKLDISLSTQSTQVSKTGGVIPDVTVNIDPSLSWSATVISNSHTQHQGYLVVESSSTGSSTAGNPQSTKLSAGFGKVYYPLVMESPQMVIEVSVDQAPTVKTQFTVTQEALTPLPMNIMDARATSYGSLTGGDHWFQYYRTYLQTASMYGTSGIVKTGTSVKITGVPSGSGYDPDVISSDYAYVHAGGQPSLYSQARHTAIVNWWKNYDRVVVYAAETRNDYLFQGSSAAATLKRTTALSERGYVYRATTGSGHTCSLNPNAMSTPVMRFLMKDGPFTNGTQVSSALKFYLDSTSTGVNPSSSPFNDGAVAVIVDAANTPMFVIDPKGKIVYSGESQFFHTSTSNYVNPPVTGATNSDISKFLGNILAYVINAAQYGSHYTDLFLEENATLYNNAFVNP